MVKKNIKIEKVTTDRKTGPGAKNRTGKLDPTFHGAPKKVKAVKNKKAKKEY
jgi:hypothetical protein